MNFIEQHLGLILTVVIGPLLTWFFITKPYQTKDLKSKDLENNSSHSSIVGQNLDLYQRMLDDVEQRAEAKFQKLYTEIDELEKVNEALKERIRVLESR